MQRLFPLPRNVMPGSSCSSFTSCLSVAFVRKILLLSDITHYRVFANHSVYLSFLMSIWFLNFMHMLKIIYSDFLISVLLEAMRVLVACPLFCSPLWTKNLLGIESTKWKCVPWMNELIRKALCTRETNSMFYVNYNLYFKRKKALCKLNSL